MTRPKLLLADDSVTIRKVVELTFADEGIDVSSAGDAESAMQKFVEIQPDIVLVDVGLSGTNGYQICEMIKQDEATAHIPVLLLVGSFEPFDQDEAERVGADGFLTKPFHSIRDLVGRVSELLGRESEADTEVPNPAFDGDATDPTLEVEAAQPNGEIEVAEVSDQSVTPETTDIEDLYKSSFAQTDEIDEFETVDDLLGDFSMDDEMIDASYAGPAAADETVVDFSSATENVEQTKDFDWSPEMVVESTPAEADAAGFEPKFAFEEEPEQTDDVTEPENVSDFDQTVDLSPVEDIPLSRNNGLAEPSPELIALLAQRIVERLSDKVIREVAQDAVPRIAEKLIREALEEDNKD